MKAATAKDSASCTALLPFANETEVQLFVENYAEKILGIPDLRVIASTRRGGGGLFKIDVLAVDDANTPFIIECKWDRVGPGAIQQLVGYKKTLLENWALFLRRVREKTGRQVDVGRREPVLVAIGYRCAPSVLGDAKSVVCLTYAYPDGTLAGDVIKQQRLGKVSIDERATFKSPHPSVCKKPSTVKAVACLPPALQKAFWRLDGRLCRLDAVRVVRYKNLVNYKTPRDIFAVARIDRKSKRIQWRYRQSGVWKSKEMLAACDAKKIFDRLRQAHVDAG